MDQLDQYDESVDGADPSMITDENGDPVGGLDQANLSVTPSQGGLAAAQEILRNAPKVSEGFTKEYQSVREQQQARADAARDTLRKARETISQKKYNERAMWFNLAAALSSPTRTGGFGETLGYGAKAMGEDAAQRENWSTDREKQLAGYDQALAGYGTGEHAVDEGMISSRLGLLALQQKLEAQKENRALQTVGHSGASTGQPEIVKLQSAIDALSPNDPKRAALQRRIQWLQYPREAATEKDSKPPEGYRWADQTRSTLEPIPGGPKDAEGSKGLGSRESVMFQRVINSGNSAAASLKNIVELPITTSTGLFGLGHGHEGSIFSSSASVLKNTLSPQEVQDYGTMLAGVSRNLATIETAGLAPNGSLTGSMDSIQLREGDTHLTKLRKLAEMRQIIEKGIEANMSNPRLPKEQKELVQHIIDVTREAVPFTQHDVTELARRQRKDPSMTFEDLFKEKHLAIGQAVGAAPTKPSNPDGTSTGISARASSYLDRVKKGE